MSLSDQLVSNKFLAAFRKQKLFLLLHYTTCPGGVIDIIARVSFGYSCWRVYKGVHFHLAQISSTLCLLNSAKDLS